MRYRLLKSWTHYEKKYPVGTIIQTTEDLIKSGHAKEEYTGEYPPRKKMKFNLKDL